MPLKKVAGQCPRCLFAVALSNEEVLTAELSPRQLGDYVLKRQIGAGGMGLVYEAQCITDGRTVALKVIRDIYFTSATSLCRFTLEGEAAARLDHPNIVRIHEIGEADGHPFFSMDLVEGESLEASIGKRPLAQDQRALTRFMAKIARAVHHAHTRGVLHRDLKPANILIDRDGEPRLTDFGLAKLLDRPKGSEPRGLTASGDAPGTPSYMSPEQVSGVEAGAAADIYGLGAVLYALLTGRPPVEGATPHEVFRRVVSESPTPPRALDPKIARDLQTICLKCLEKEARQRYGSAEALAQDLERFAEGRPIAARPATVRRRTQRWIKRNPVGTALIATLCAGLLVALVLLRIVNTQRREIELDRDLAFEEGMQKISQIWRDPATKSVSISARELGILAGRSPVDIRHARYQLTIAVSADDGPSSMAQRYARLLNDLQSEMARELREPVAFHLLLLKRFSEEEETLLRGEANFIILSAVDFLRARRASPGIQLIAQARTAPEGVIFARTNISLGGLRGRSVAFPDDDLSLTACAQACLVAAGLRRSDFQFATNIFDRGPESGETIISTSETLALVVGGKIDAGVTYRSQFERYRHLGLAVLATFRETPKILAAGAGVEPRIVAALTKAIDQAPWPESKFVTGGAALEELCAALDDAERFDQ